MAIKLFSQIKEVGKNQGIVKKFNLWCSIALIYLLVTHINDRSFVKESEWLVTETPKRDFCSMVANQLIQKKASPVLFDDGLYELITRDNYQALPFNGKEIVSSVWTNTHGCKVYIKDDQLLRSLDFSMEESDEYPYYWIISRVRENEMFEREDV